MSETLAHKNIASAAYDLQEKWHSPFFLYDLDQLKAHLATMMVPQGVSLFYAVKANPLSAILDEIDQAGLRFDVASLGEMRQVLARGVQPDTLINTGPAKSAIQIEQMLQAGLRTFVAESRQQLGLLNKLAQDLAIGQLNILLRLQTPPPVKGEGDESTDDRFDPLAMASVFGQTPEEWSKEKLTDYPALNVIGCHCFQWSNLLSVEELLGHWKHIIPIMKQVSNTLGFDLKIADFGGGIGVPYKQDQDAFNWSHFCEQVTRLKEQLPETEIWMELGRYAVAGCGYYYNPVIERKSNWDQTQLVMAGGVNHLMRPPISGQAFPATMVKDQHDADTPTESTETPCDTAEIDVFGPLCTGLDKLGRFTLPNSIKAGDWLRFDMVGAYGFTEGMPFFLCHTLPGEAVFKDRQCTLLRVPEEADTWLR